MRKEEFSIKSLNSEETKEIKEQSTPAVAEPAQDIAVSGNLDETPRSAFKVFETKADWQAEIDRIVSSRLKEYKRLKEQVTEQEKFISELTEYIKSNEGIGENGSDQWFADLMDLAEQYPGINLSELAKNEKFISLLTKGMSAEDAYKLTNHDDLIELAKQNEKESFISRLRAKGERPLEVGLNPRNGMMVKPDPSKFSKKELEEIGNRVMRGEKITL